MVPRQIRRLLILLAASPVAGCSGSPFLNPPFASDVNRSSIPQGAVGSTVVVQGLNFTATPDSLVFTSTGGTADLAPLTKWLDDIIIAKVPPNAATGVMYVETAAGPGGTGRVFTVLPQDSFPTPSGFGWKLSPRALPVGLSGQAAASAELLQVNATVRTVYSIGGADNLGNPTANVYYATVDSAGNLSSAWTQTVSLPSPLAFPAAVALTLVNSLVTPQGPPGFLLVLGGATDRSGTPSSVIYQAQLTATGAVATGGFTPLGIALPAAVHSLGAFVYFNNVYIVGGATTGNAPVSTVYRSEIQSNGVPISWIAEAALPRALSHAGVVQWGGNIYVVGGDGGVATPNDSAGSTAVPDIVFAPIDPSTRRLSLGWAKAAVSLATPRAGLAAIGAGAPGAGVLLVSGGLYSGDSTGASEENIVGLNPGAVPASVTKGSASINALCSCNLFNQAATSYRDGLHHYHLLVVGGDDVNTPGKKHTETFVY